jgi:hypothetical protein
VGGGRHHRRRLFAITLLLDLEIDRAEVLRQENHRFFELLLVLGDLDLALDAEIGGDAHLEVQILLSLGGHRLQVQRQLIKSHIVSPNRQ